MKKIIYIFILLISLLLITWILYIKLPVSITRKADIKFGNELAQKIDNEYLRTKKLPKNNDWETLKKLGFKFNDEVCTPAYSKINNNEYELIYIEGFDPPYLLYNSKTKKWDNGFPKIPEKNIKESNFPWSQETTENAVNAILVSIDNVKQNPNYKGNFPTDVNNMPFIRITKADFEIIGYSVSDNSPNTYQIDFIPKDEYKSGPRFTVEIDIETNKAIRVYMTPDA